MRVCDMSGDEGSSVQASVDEKTTTKPGEFRIQSPLFNVTLPESNVFGTKPGLTPMLSGGWWILLEPLPPETHDIHLVE